MIWVGTTLAFAIYQSGGSLLRGRWPALVCIDSPNVALLCSGFLEKLLVAAIICGSGLAIHELAHRAAARKEGAEAFVSIGALWLVLPILLAFAGFFVVAPGVVWRGRGTAARLIGWTALAGPLANLAISLLFFAVLSGIVVGRVPVAPWFPYVGYAGFRFHALFLLCSLLPLGRFDGAQVLPWNWAAWAGMLGAGVLLTFGLGDEHVLQWLLRLVTGR